MDTIFVEGMECIGVHGITEKEQKPQKFVVTVEADVESAQTLRAVAGDNIGDATDYRVIRDTVEGVMVSGPRRNLLETLACSIATSMFAQLPQVRKVRVKIMKSGIWRNGSPGVLVRRKRQEG